MIKRSLLLLSIAALTERVFAPALATNPNGRVPTVDDLLMVKSAGGAQISPDGTLGSLLRVRDRHETGCLRQPHLACQHGDG